MTGSAIEQIFGLGPAQAFIVAASIEVAGFGINAYCLEAQAFNESEKAHDERYHAKTRRLPLENVAGAKKAVTWFYIVTGCIVGFNAIYQVAANGKDAIMLLAILFPVASAIATSAANKRAALHRKLVRSRETDTKVAKPLQSGNETTTKPEPIKPQLDERQIATLEAIRNGAATRAEVGRALGVSHTTAGKAVKALMVAGAVSENGHGLRVKA